MESDYGQGAYATQRSESSSYLSSSYGLESSKSRFGPYELYDSRSSLGGSDLYISGHGYSEPEPSRFADSYDDRYESSYRNSVDSFGDRNQGGSSWEAPYSHTQLRTGFMDDRGGESYSSYSSFTSPQMKPAPAGSRGRGMPSYPEGAFGSRSYEAFGGSSAGRGRGRGQMGGYGGIQRPGIVVDYQNKSSFGGPAGRGIKRKMPQPLNKPVGLFVGKKPKLAKPDAKTDNKNEEEEKKRRVEARRAKQRRRREKNNEKYGDGYRIGFTCSFCKFRTFEEKDIEDHLESTTHQETLDHIQKKTKFGKVVMQFLHKCMVNKFKKTAMRKAQTNWNEAAKMAEKDILEGVSAKEQMMKVETMHCSACSTYVPALQSSVQQHIKSSDHAKSKLAYKELIKRQSVLTATSILNNPIVKLRYELFAMGENLFEIEQASEEAAEEASEVVEEAAQVNEANEEVQEEVNEDENEQNEEEEVDENEEESNDVEAAEPNDGDPTTTEEN